ncbi:hypothetical protein JMUB7533_26880 [Staphylococcus aureus]
MSRGLGDVYKRQLVYGRQSVKHWSPAVSYTHLTLPTKLEV